MYLALVAAVVICGGVELSYGTPRQRYSVPGKRLLDLLLERRAVDSRCPQGHFQCSTSGVCLESYFRCNGHDECGDNSDELNCCVLTCPEGRVPCPNNVRCIEPLWRCDGDNDCGDFSDEKDCANINHLPPDISLRHASKSKRDPITSRVKAKYARRHKRRAVEGGAAAGDNPSCTEDEQRCADGSDCILKSWVCDGGSPDCSDGSDEANCAEHPCLPNYFKCSQGGKCIRQAARCNGVVDCPDESDESNCPPVMCLSGFFKCVNGSLCIPVTWRCDGDSDCRDGSDELDCLGRSCLPERPVRCQSTGTCKPSEFLCDGRQQCPDGSDERNCEQQVCRSGYRKCANNVSCVANGWFCDGDDDCSDGSDEQNCPNRAN